MLEADLDDHRQAGTLRRMAMTGRELILEARMLSPKPSIEPTDQNTLLILLFC
jgi:hypothetical protein